MAKLTFIHAADVHLGAPFRGLRALSEKWADRLLRAIPEAFDRVIEAAIANRVDFVVIAGDVFDTSRPSYADYLRFFEGCRRLGEAGIPVYFCSGNHDPYTSWQHSFAPMPDNVTMFGAAEPSFHVYREDGEPLALLGGRGYYNQTWSQTEDISAGISRNEAEEACGVSAPFAIGVLHTGLNLDPYKAPCDPDALRARGMDYWACGHIHLPWRDDPRDPKIAYSGIIQGRDIKETGARGVWLVTLEEGSPNRANFIPTASVVWERIDVDVSELDSIASVSDRVMRELFRANGDAHCEEMVVRVTLKGATPLHEVLQRPGVIEDLRSSINAGYAPFFCDALVDGTSRPIDREALARESLFPSVFLQAASAQRADGAAQRAYLQDEFIDRGLALPSRAENSIDRLSARAEEAVLDLLLGRGEQ